MILQNIKYKLLVSIFVINSILICSEVRSAPTSTTVTISGNVVPRTCTFEEKEQSVLLEDVTSNSFSNQGISGMTEFMVNITSCHESVSRLKITISGASEPDSTGTLFLNTGTASNVGLRLSFADDDHIISPAGEEREVVITNGNANLKMKAAYMATALPVEPGSFYSTANLFFEYM